MVLAEWQSKYNGFVEKNNLQNMIKRETVPSLTWIDEKPWIYIDNLMRIIVPTTSVYPIIAEVLNYFEDMEYNLIAEGDTALQDEFSQFSKFSEREHTYQGVVSGTKFANALISIAKHNLSEKLTNLKLTATSEKNLLVANSEGFIFIDGARLTHSQIDDIVYLILDSHDKAKEYQFVRNKIKHNFQIVILHEKAPLIVKKI